MLLCGTANPELGRRISEEVGVALAPMEITRFADGEFDVRIGESVRGHDVFVIQPTCPPVNDNYMELFVILDALRRASAARINAVLPYYGYQRKEKKTRARDPISAKLMANFLQVAGAERMIVLDLHAEAIQGFFDIPVDALTASKILASHVRSRHGRQPIVVVSPDVGGTARARAIARLLESPLAIIDKRRPRDDDVEVLNVIGDVQDSTCVVVDDLISTASTLAGAAHALKEGGARSVDVLATHGVLSAGSLDRLTEAFVDEVVVTDTIPLSSDAARNDKVSQVSVAPLIAEAIVRIHEGRSVSALFR
ncbi:MAG: ribose-phosphate pyrophosphokinase [Candidatus Dormibacteraeota bacterium]|jgi:ribose-phosphate pyrophosphokinase|nr:ribose-phosphate pyrophosphokinase [Candidatus Dormibacteraeota bacterium]